MNDGKGRSEEGNAQGVVAWIVVFAVAGVVTGFCAKYWAAGNLIPDDSGIEVSGGLVVGIAGLTALYILLQLLRILYDRWAN